MSEDLRYYFFDNEAEPDPPVSSEEGWKQMEQMLDLHMPEKRRRIIAYWPYAAAASLLIAFATFFFYTNHQSKQTELVNTTVQDHPGNDANEQAQTAATNNHKSTTPAEQSLTRQEPVSVSGSDIKYADQAYTNKSLGSPVYTSNTQHQQLTGSNTNNNNAAAKEELTLLAQSNTSAGIESGLSNNTSSENNSKANSPTTQNNNKNKTLPGLEDQSTPSLIKPKRENRTGTWNFAAGVGVNMATAGNTQALQPYPTVETKYNINNRLYLLAGIAPYAPTTSAASGVDKSTVVNDLARNVSRYDERTTYSRVNYLDIPLMAGVNLTKHLSLQGGVQLSYMLNSKSEKAYETYDLAYTMVDQSATMMVPIGPSFNTEPVIEKQTEVNVRKTDYRYVAGLQYTLKRTTIGLNYQQGLQPVLSGTNASSKKNNLVSLKVNFRLK